jgi:TrmH family RNA methyltransferase
MPERKRIDSTQNPRVKTLVRLKERRTRNRENRYVIEGVREISRAATSGVTLQELYVCAEYLRSDGLELVTQLEALDAIEVLELSREAFDKASHRESPDGLLAVAAMRAWRLDALELPENALVLVLDGLEKPGNLGALLRTADGAGLHAVFVTGEGTDLFNPNVIRSSMGSVFSLPVVPVDVAELLPWLQARDFSLIATSPEAEATYWDVDYRGASAIVLGTEHAGLPGAWFDAATARVAIPMGGLADSLNVATAGALLMYEALRQRRK